MRPTGSGVRRPRHRSRDSVFRLAFEELKFIKSLHDLRNYGRTAAYYLRRLPGNLTRSGTAPESLQIEPTNLCNTACLSCPVPRMKRKRGRMDMELFRKIIDDASHMGVARVRLFLHGEPLIHPGFIDMVRYCKSKRMSVQITTNGTLMTQKRADALLGAGVDSSDHVTFSILGSTKESHERIMQRGDYDGEVRNIMDLLQRRRESGVNGPVVETIFYRMPENEGEEEAYLDTWRPIVDHARLGGRISESFAGYKKGSGSVPQRTRTCLNLWERMTVFWNGDVTICNEDVDGDWVVGNLRDESIASIWNGERLSALRTIHREKQFSKFPFCNECDM